MQTTEYTALFAPLLPIARQAGEAIMAIYRSEHTDVALKSDQSPLTAADTAAHRVLAQALGTLPLGCPVVSEEDEGSQADRTRLARFWLIDPLDGTKEFIARNGEFTVNIALIENHRSVLGVVYAPAIDCMYWGGAGLGAFKMQGADSQAIAVAAGHDAGVCRVVASKSHLNADTQSFIDRLGQVQLVQAGSSLKFCRLAEGAADVYPRLAPTCEWDTAAAQAVLEGAGGAVVDLQGQPLRYGKADVLNPSFIATRDLTLIPS
jgi:3'(2'), 5'-bisphosphate nucleotidase